MFLKNYESFSIGNVIAEDVGKEIAEDVAKEGVDTIVKESAGIASKEAAHEAAEEAAKEASKKSVVGVLKDGAKDTGKWVVKNPIKTAGIGIVGVSGAEALIDKKKFSDVFAKNVGKTVDAAEPVTEEIIKAGAKGTEQAVKSLKPAIELASNEATNIFDKFFNSIFGKFGAYVKWGLIIISVLIVIYILYNTFRHKRRMLII